MANKPAFYGQNGATDPGKILDQIIMRRVMPPYFLAAERVKEIADQAAEQEMAQFFPIMASKFMGTTHRPAVLRTEWAPLTSKYKRYKGNAQFWVYSRQRQAANKRKKQKAQKKLGTFKDRLVKYIAAQNALNVFGKPTAQVQGPHRLSRATGGISALKKNTGNSFTVTINATPNLPINLTDDLLDQEQSFKLTNWLGLHHLDDKQALKLAGRQRIMPEWHRPLIAPLLQHFFDVKIPKAVIAALQKAGFQAHENAKSASKEKQKRRTARRRQAAAKKRAEEKRSAKKVKKIKAADEKFYEKRQQARLNAQKRLEAQQRTAAYKRVFDRLMKR